MLLKYQCFNHFAIYQYSLALAGLSNYNFIAVIRSSLQLQIFVGIVKRVQETELTNSFNRETLLISCTILHDGCKIVDNSKTVSHQQILH